MVQCRPLPTTGLCLADYEALMGNISRPYPFGLVGTGSVYRNAIHYLFIDHTKSDHIDDLYMIDLPKPGQPVPMVNMVLIRQLPDDSLHNIMEASPDAYS